jgi:hypothetical protein
MHRHLEEHTLASIAQVARGEAPWPATDPEPAR